MKNSGLSSKLGVSYIRRKDGTKKKAKELSVLCGIDACVQIIGPEGDIDSWPENPNEIRSVIERYRKGFGTDQKNKKRAVTGGKNKKRVGMGEICDGGEGLSTKELEALLGDVDKKLKDVRDRIEVVSFMNCSQNNVKAGASNSTEKMISYGCFPEEMFDCKLGQGQDQSFGDNALMWSTVNPEDTSMNGLQYNVKIGASSSTENMSYGYFPVQMFDCDLGQDQSFGDNALMSKRVSSVDTFMNDNFVASNSEVTMNDGYIPMVNNIEMFDWGLDQDQYFGEDAGMNMVNFEDTLVWNMDDFKAIGIEF